MDGTWLTGPSLGPVPVWGVVAGSHSSDAITVFIVNGPVDTARASASEQNREKGGTNRMVFEVSGMHESSQRVAG